MTPQEFIQKYNELAKESGYTIQPVMRLEVVKIPEHKEKKDVDKEGKKS